MNNKVKQIDHRGWEVLGESTAYTGDGDTNLVLVPGTKYLGLFGGIARFRERLLKSSKSELADTMIDVLQLEKYTKQQTVDELVRVLLITPQVASQYYDEWLGDLPNMLKLESGLHLRGENYIRKN